MKFAIVDTHPEGCDALLTEPAPLEAVGMFGSRYEVERLMALKVGEVWNRWEEHNQGIKRTE